MWCKIVWRKARHIWWDFGSVLSFQTRLTQTKPVLPLSKEHGSQVKDQGRRQCCHNKHKKFPYRLTRDVSLLSWYASYEFEGKLAVLNCIHSASFHNIFHVNAVGISDQWHTNTTDLSTESLWSTTLQLTLFFFSRTCVVDTTMMTHCSVETLCGKESSVTYRRVDQSDNCGVWKM
jgi:hypothetical protein